MRQRLDTRVDRRTLRRTIEQPRMLEGIVAILPLERVHHPSDIAHAADDLGLRKQPHECRKLRGPGTIRVEDHRLRKVSIIGIEQATKNSSALRLADHGGEFGPG